MDDDLVPIDECRRNTSLVKHLDLLDPVRWQNQPIPERRWLVEGLIPDRNVTLLAGDGGVGKTLLALQLAVACSLGRQWLGLQTKAVKTLCVLCEDEPEEIQRRVADILKLYQADFGDTENLSFLARVGLDNSLMTWPNSYEPGGETAFHTRILNLATDQRYQLVILDSLHDFFPGNENARPQVRQFIQSLRTIATEADGAVIVTTHPSLAGRSSGTGESGSTAWNNAVRSRLYLTRPNDANDENERILQTMKSNYGAIGGRISLTWQGGVFVREDGDGGVLGSIKRRTTTTVFLNALVELGRQGRRVNANENQQNFAPKVMVEMPECKGYRLKELKRAMEELLHDNQIVVAKDGPPSRRRTYLAKPDASAGGKS